MSIDSFFDYRDSYRIRRLDYVFDKLIQVYGTQPFCKCFDINGGFAFKSTQYKEKGVFILRVTNISPDCRISLNDAKYLGPEKYNDYKDYQLAESDILIVMIGGSIGKVGIVPKIILPAVLNQNMWKVANPNRFPFRYIYYLVLFLNNRNKNIKSMSYDFFTRKTYRNLQIPNINIQVAEEVASFLDKYYGNNSICNVSWLNAEEQKMLSDSLRVKRDIDGFGEENSIQISLLQGLRNAVLQEAIEGKLTAEWRKHNSSLISGENHASKLLEKIRAEKNRLIKEDHMRKAEPLPSIAEDKKPFVLPDGWVWCRLGEICNIQTGKKDANEGCEDGLYNFYTCAQKSIKSNTYSFEGESILLPGNGANVGFSIYLNERFEAYQRTYVLNNFYAIYVKYIFTLLQASWKERLGMQYGSAINYIKIGNITNFIVPLPSVFEQKAIVEKVDKLMVMIDELVKQVTDRKNQSERLMQSVLREAFAKE